MDVAAAVITSRTELAVDDWTRGLPVLAGAGLRLRELSIEDAHSLCSLMSVHEVSRFISPAPSSVDAFQRFIEWTHDQRRAGKYACFAIVPAGMDTAVGLFQVRSLEPGFANAEWGFVIASEFWGTGLFTKGARLVIDFAFDVIGVTRLEARSATANGRGNAALQKIGAVREGVLRASLSHNGVRQDQALWSILAADWRVQRLPQEASFTS